MIALLLRHWMKRDDFRLLFQADHHPNSPSHFPFAMFCPLKHPNMIPTLIIIHRTLPINFWQTSVLNPLGPLQRVVYPWLSYTASSAHRPFASALTTAWRRILHPQSTTHISYAHIFPHVSHACYRDASTARTSERNFGSVGKIHALSLHKLKFLRRNNQLQPIHKHLRTHRLPCIDPLLHFAHALMLCKTKLLFMFIPTCSVYNITHFHLAPCPATPTPVRHVRPLQYCIRSASHNLQSMAGPQKFTHFLRFRLTHFFQFFDACFVHFLRRCLRQRTKSSAVGPIPQPVANHSETPLAPTVRTLSSYPSPSYHHHHHHHHDPHHPPHHLHHPRPRHPDAYENVFFSSSSSSYPATAHATRSFPRSQDHQLSPPICCTSASKLPLSFDVPYFSSICKTQSFKTIFDMRTHQTVTRCRPRDQFANHHRYFPVWRGRRLRQRLPHCICTRLS